MLRCCQILLLNVQEEDAEIYDEVTEDQYKSVVQGRLAKDDFVLDDGIGGYVDNGMDDWGNADDDAQDDSGDEIMRKSST
jgi:DNA polymerase alpha subunit A